MQLHAGVFACLRMRECDCVCVRARASVCVCIALRMQFCSRAYARMDGLPVQLCLNNDQAACSCQESGTTCQWYTVQAYGLGLARVSQRCPGTSTTWTTYCWIGRRRGLQCVQMLFCSWAGALFPSVWGSLWSGLPPLAMAGMVPDAQMASALCNDRRAYSGPSSGFIWSVLGGV